jgi:hypothetical protein
MAQICRRFGSLSIPKELRGKEYSFRAELFQTRNALIYPPPTRFYGHALLSDLRKRARHRVVHRMGAIRRLRSTVVLSILSWCGPGTIGGNDLSSNRFILSSWALSLGGSSSSPSDACNPSPISRMIARLSATSMSIWFRMRNLHQANPRNAAWRDNGANE